MTYEFTLIIEAIDLADDEALDALFEAGLDDATPSIIEGVQSLDVTRDGPSYPAALFSAVRQAQQAGAVVRHVVDMGADGEPLPGLVSQSDIARRTGWSREYVRLLAKGARGPGGFPVPMRMNSPTLHGWADVLSWLSRNRSTADIAERIADLDHQLVRANVTRLVNAVLETQESDERLRDLLASEADAVLGEARALHRRRRGVRQRPPRSTAISVQ